MIKNILICDVKYPFVRGGAELLLDGLNTALTGRGYHTEVVSIPFLWNPKEALLRSAAIWRMLDLRLYRYQPVDLVIATKFPSYLIPAEQKITWLFHQYREAYDLWGKPGTQFDPQSDSDRRLRDEIIALDELGIKESHRVATISKTVSARLKKFNQIDSDPIYTPPRLAEHLKFESVGDYLFTVSRLEINKRIDLLIRGYALSSRHKKFLIGGTGPQREALEQLTHELGVADQVKFLGYLSDAEMIAHYGRCHAVAFVPDDEDYGYITLEALLSGKPVVTVADSGGVMEFIRDGENGFVAASDPEALGKVLSNVMALSGDDLKGRVGVCRGSVTDITWDKALDQLLAGVQ